MELLPSFEVLDFFCNLKSVQTAEQEKAMREMQLNDWNQVPGVYSPWKVYLLSMVQLYKHMSVHRVSMYSKAENKL